MFTRQRPQPALPQPPEELTKPAPQPSIHELSYSELKAFHEHVGQVLAQRAAQARLDFKRDFIDRMSELGLTLDDLRPEKPKKERKPRETKPKYQHGDNTWNGKGRTPAWMQELLEQGRSLDEFLISGAPAEPAPLS